MTAAYVVGLLVIVVALVAWPGDVDRSAGIAPPPPEAAPFPAAADDRRRVPPPPPPPPPPAPRPRRTGSRVELLQQTIVSVETQGEVSTLEAVNDTLPAYLSNATGASSAGGDVHDDHEMSFVAHGIGLDALLRHQEDAPLWLDQLPQFFDVADPPAPYAVTYRTSCLPNLASQYSMTDNGVIRAARGERARPGLHGVLRSGSRPRSPRAAASQTPGWWTAITRCRRSVRHDHDAGEHRHRPAQRRACRGGGRARVVLHGRRGFRHDERGRRTRRPLVPLPAPPARRSEPGRVGRGRRLAQVHHQRPAEERVRRDHRREPLLLGPNPGFIGSDYFRAVDDSRSNDAEYVLYARARVERAGWRGGRACLAPMPSDFWVLEDTALDGKLYRTPGVTRAAAHAELLGDHPAGERRG